MNYALIKNGVVVNVIVADDNFIQTISDQYDAIVKTDAASIGMQYIDGGFVGAV